MGSAGTGATFVNRPRLAFLNVAPTARGGIAQFGAGLARAAETAGARALVLAYSRLYPRWTTPGRQPPEPAPGDHDLDVVDGLVPWRPRTWRAAARTLDAAGSELLVVQWWSPITGPCVWWLVRNARRAGRRVVVVCHNARPHERFPAWRILTRSALGSADVLVALSEPVAAELRALLPAMRPRVLGHPPNLAVATAAREEIERWRTRLDVGHGPVVLFFGNVRAYKGLPDLIEAWPTVVRAHPTATLVIAGTFFEPTARYERRLAQLGVGDSVRLHPEYVPADEVAGLLGAADLLVLPYRSASQSGVTALAAAAGCPVVATAVGGLPEALPPGCATTPPADPAMLAAAVSAALANPPRAPGLGTGWEVWAAMLAREAAAARRTAAGARRPSLYGLRRRRDSPSVP